MLGIKYSLLNDTKKAIFKELFAHINNDELKFSLSGFSGSDVRDVITDVIEDNPQFFWLSGGASFMTCGSQVEITLGIRGNMSVSEIKKKKKELNETVKKIVDKALAKESLFDRMLFVHDYIVDSTDYLLGAENCYDAYGCLVLHKAVCAGYAKAFQLVMQQLKIPTVVVIGTTINDTGTGHEWNIVKIENDYYYVDVTWDDPIFRENDRVHNRSYDYFCISEKELKPSHKLTEDSLKLKCNSDKYNYHVYKGYYLKSYSFPEIKKIALSQLKCEKSFSVKFSSKTELKRALKDLSENGKIFDILELSGWYARGKYTVYHTVSRNELILKFYCE